MTHVSSVHENAGTPQGRQQVLKHSRWLLLKRPERLTEEQEPKLAELLKHNLRTVRAYLLKEDFQLL